MGAQLTPEGVKFNGYDDVQTKPVNSVNGQVPNSQGEITIDVGGGGRVLIFNSSGTYNKPAGVVGLEIIMVAGGQGGGSTFMSMSHYVRPTAGGNTTISGLPGGDKIAYGGGSIETLKGALTTWGVGYYGYIATPNTGNYKGQTGGYGAPHNSSLMGGGQGGYGGEDGGPSIFLSDVYNTTQSSYYPDSGTYWNSSLGGNGGGGYRAKGSAISPPNKSLSGGQGATHPGTYGTAPTYSGDASDWYLTAPLGGEAQGDNTVHTVKGGSGKFSGGGGGASSGSIGAGGGGGGIGAGGGCASTSAASNFFTGGVSGEHLEFTISVPSASASYNIEVGAGGDGAYSYYYSSNDSLNYSSGGGGQGIVIIKEISDITISTP